MTKETGQGQCVHESGSDIRVHEHTLTLFGISPSEAKDPVVSPGFAAAGFKGRALRFGGPENGLNPVFLFTGCLNNQNRNTVNISKSKNDFLAARIA